jgi:hypothetical protein
VLCTYAGGMGDGMQNTELQVRLERFGSLQAAYRALARSVHPAELAPVREQGKSFLIQLQDLSARAETQPELLGEVAFQRIDQALNEQADRTRSILSGMEMSQLRATIPTLSSTHPGEVAGLVDVLLSGDLEDDKNLRTLEYLVTMLSAEERGGRRIVAKNPAKVTAQLKAVSQQKLREGATEALEAERMLETAASKVLQETEVGDTRDRMRDYKESLGSLVLHPRVLAAAVAYNIAMWNKVAVEIDSSRAMEQLAEQLFDTKAQPAGASAAPPRDSNEDVLGSREFDLLMQAFRARIAGDRSEDSRANNLAATIALEKLRAEDVEVLEADPEDESIWLMQAAIVVGGLLTKRDEATSPAAVLGLDLDSLEGCGVDDLMDRMTERGRKCFASSEYPEAFRLADIKTHNLMAHAAARAEAGPRDGSSAREAEPEVARASWLRGISVSPSAVLVVVAAALFGLASLGGSDGERTAAGAEMLAQISPFLATEQPADATPGTRTARLNRAWNYLGTEERRGVAMEIGGNLASDEGTRVVMMDDGNQIAASYSAGELVVLVPLDPEA